MLKKIFRLAALVLVLTVALAALTGCEKQGKPKLTGVSDNDILTFESNKDSKPVIRIGMQYYAPDMPIISALQARYPEYLFVYDYMLTAGTDSEKNLPATLKNDNTFDLLVTSRHTFTDDPGSLLVDLSAESFLDDYLLSALNFVSHDGRIYFLPSVSTLTGIAYNVDMFSEKGWQVPSNQEEFFTLCGLIRAEGIHPICNCFKYDTQVNVMFGTMSYNELYMTVDDVRWIGDVQQNKAAYKGHMEPFYELAKRFYDEELSTIDSFSASLTKQRHAFWAGECAMMFYNSTIFTYAQAEHAPFEVGLMPFPAQNSEQSGFSILPSYYFSIPKSVERDKERLALMKDILGFISSPDGQKAMLRESLSISNVKGIEMSNHPAYKYMDKAYKAGNLYPVIEYNNTSVNIAKLQGLSIRTLFEGASVEQAIASMDSSLQKEFAEATPKEKPEVLARAEKPFTLLETSCYIADKLREASGAQIALMINGGYFLSNLARFDAGDITSDLNKFVMKGATSDDCLTTYRMTGAQLRALLERPIVNGAQTDVFIAASGLNIEYAPWNERGSRVLSVTLSDGAELKDDEAYTVAAWTGVIDEGYAPEIVQAHTELGELPRILADALRQDKDIKPDLSSVKLVWQDVKQ